MHYCAQCGQKVTSADGVCPNCGTKSEGAAADAEANRPMTLIEKMRSPEGQVNLRGEKPPENLSYKRNEILAILVVIIIGVLMLVFVPKIADIVNGTDTSQGGITLEWPNSNAEASGEVSQ